jgi:hypothetical protein
LLQFVKEILLEMNANTRMKPGKLCVRHPRAGSPPFYMLQSSCQVKNQTRYVPADEVPAIQEALAGHGCLPSLVFAVRPSPQEGETIFRVNPAPRSLTPGYFPATRLPRGIRCQESC